MITQKRISNLRRIIGKFNKKELEILVYEASNEVKRRCLREASIYYNEVLK